MIDRSAASRALAKAIAFKACGKEAEARMWAAHLVMLLECAAILTHDDGTSAYDRALLADLNA